MAEAETIDPDADEFRVEDNPEKSRYEAFLGNEPVGFMDYQDRPDRFVAMHTEIRDEYEGQGLGSRFVSTVLDRMRATNRLVQPKCPFVQAYMKRHPEYNDLIFERR